MSEANKIRVGITQGDMNGIGPETIIRVLADGAMNELITAVIYSSPKIIQAHRKATPLEDFQIHTVKGDEPLNPRKVNLVDCVNEEIEVEFGQPSETSGRVALKCIDAAIEDLKRGYIDVMVTAPVDKHAVARALPGFTGHTGYIRTKLEATEALMLLVSDGLRVGLVTEHLPLRDVANAVTIEKIVAKGKLMAKSLLEDFCIRKPRIAVLGLNPHAGDGGELGNEEKDIILPAVDQLQNAGIMAYGPYAADGFFGSGNWQKFDGVLAMYHDQGLAPFKAVAFSSGVNFTAGLPYIRTSPDHGTAFDIAGKNEASEASLREAIYLAVDVFKKRANWKEISADPLKSAPRQREGRER
ncbi:MAG TPA: 4-hydroxythreonine-4-phosphate dehydrogenase PdxA [Bacteroidia bacterium]|nr:4-hydroxythreonine-4-phosphate dehydrogenase PdxA [Bacteroidia bacterium]